MDRLKAPRFANILEMLAPPPKLVQLYLITVDGQQLLCVGPHLPPPKNHDNAYIVEDIQFGDPIPLDIAHRLLDGVGEEPVQ
jgi:hypothetical protein